MSFGVAGEHSQRLPVTGDRLLLLALAAQRHSQIRAIHRLGAAQMNRLHDQGCGRFMLSGFRGDQPEQVQRIGAVGVPRIAGQQLAIDAFGLPVIAGLMLSYC